MSFVYHQRKFVASDQAVIPIDNRNFLYGDGVFESIRCMNGKPLFVQLHAERLQHGLEKLKLQTDTLLDKNSLSQIILELNHLNDYHQGVRIRLVVGRNSGNTYKPEKNSASVYVTSLPVAENYYPWLDQGLQVGLFEDIKKPINIFSGFKSCNSLLYVMASLYFSEQKMDDCLLVNTNDHICEGSSSNLFWFKNDVLYTPPLSDGCINGVLRSVLILHFGAIEQTCTLPELMEADELFLTNMGAGIRWIKKFKGKTGGHTRTKMLFNELNKKLISGVFH